jgi:hypothetical protein
VEESVNVLLLSVQDSVIGIVGEDREEVVRHLSVSPGVLAALHFFLELLEEPIGNILNANCLLILLRAHIMNHCCDGCVANLSQHLGPAVEQLKQGVLGDEFVGHWLEIILEQLS